MRDLSGNILLTFPRQLNADDADLTIESVAVLTGTWAPATATRLTSVTVGNVATETWQVAPPVPGTPFFVRLNATLR